MEILNLELSAEQKEALAETVRVRNEKLTEQAEKEREEATRYAQQMRNDEINQAKDEKEAEALQKAELTIDFTEPEPLTVDSIFNEFLEKAVIQHKENKQSEFIAKLQSYEISEEQQTAILKILGE